MSYVDILVLSDEIHTARGIILWQTVIHSIPEFLVFSLSVCPFVNSLGYHFVLTIGWKFP